MEGYDMIHINFAYLDPGTGSMLVQSLIGIIAGIGLFGRKALRTLRMKKRSESPQEDQPLD
jgi:hypothetical protein